MKKCIVTGGAGFVGSHLVDRLVRLGEVTVYDNLSSGKTEHIKHHIGENGFTIIEGDILDRTRLSDAMIDQDIVFHMAANPDVIAGIEETDLDLKQGTIGTYNVLDAARSNGVNKIVFASSSTVYGNLGTRSIDEDFGPLMPISLYGASKLACEGLITAFCHLFDMQAWIYRFANVIGPRLTHGVLFDFLGKLSSNHEILQILGDGKQSKPYIHVDDCVDGMLYGLQNSQNQVNVFNLGNSQSVSVQKIAKLLLEEMNLQDVQMIFTGGKQGWPGDVPQVRINIKKMMNLGWQPKRNSEEAIRDTITSIINGI